MTSLHVLAVEFVYEKVAEIPAHVEVHINSARLVATKEPRGTCA